MSDGMGSQTHPITAEHQQDPDDRPSKDDDCLVFSEFLHALASLAQSQLPQDPIGTKTEKTAAWQADREQDQECDHDRFPFNPECFEREFIGF